MASGRGVRSGTRRAAILEAIRTAPGIGLGELASQIYEEDTATNRGRVQSLVSTLKRGGAVRSAGRGRFEAS